MKRSVAFRSLTVITLLMLVATVMMWFPAIYTAQSVSYTYQAVNRNIAANGSYCGQQVSCNVIGSGAQYHQLTWNKVGTVSACSVTVDTSADNVTWSSGGAITAKDCSSNGTSISTSVIANYVRMTVSSFAGTGTIALNLTGFLNAPGGGGSVSSLTATAPVVATPSPITGVGVFSCPTCVVATVNPVAGVGHFAGSTQTITSSPIVNADITNGTIDLTTKVVNVLPQANGGKVQVVTSNQGYFWGTCQNAMAGLGSTAITSLVSGSANQVRAWQCVLPYSITINKVSIEVQVNSAAQTCNVGIYSADKTTKLLDSGTFDMAVGAGAPGTTRTNTLGSPVIVSGPIWVAFSCSDTTAAIGAAGAALGANVGAVFANIAGGPIMGSSANATSAGVMPASLGTITSATAISTSPLWRFEP